MTLKSMSINVRMRIYSCIFVHNSENIFKRNNIQFFALTYFTVVEVQIDLN